MYAGYPAGQELLLDLINLYEDTKTRTPIGQAQLIIDWWLSEKEDAGKRTTIETCTEKQPKLELALQPAPDGRIMLLPEVNSVIDAAYYALARFMAVNTGALEDWGRKTTIAFCEGCGRAYIKRGDRQKYCGNRECEAIRNSRKPSRYYYKEKAKT